MGFLAALASLAQPILARVLVALGFSVVTFGGATAIIGSLKAQVLSSLGDSSLAALQLAGLAGVWVGLGIVFGAVTFTVTLWGLTKAVRIGAG